MKKQFRRAGALMLALLMLMTALVTVPAAWWR